MAADDGFATVSTKKSRTKQLQISNLPSKVDTKALQKFLGVSNLGDDGVTSVPASDYQRVLALDGRSWEGRKLRVHPPRKFKGGGNAFGGREWSQPKTVKPPSSTTREPVEQSVAATDTSTTSSSAVTSLQSAMGGPMESLQSLLADYGEYDPDWKKVVVVEEQPPALQNSLTRHGQAPIHVEFQSFGYKYGKPSPNHIYSRVYDSRDELEPVPSYMQWQDGRSGTVKRELQRQGKQLIYKVADETAELIVEALRDGYGYLNPLQMTIFVGSELGRHRSVWVCELAATSLRKKLRANDRFTEPCSVGTAHRDVDRGKSARKGRDDDA